MILTAIAILLSIAAAAATVTLAKIQTWLRRHAMTGADLIKTSLAGGNYSIVAIGFDTYGIERGRDRWETSSIDSSLRAQFGTSNRARIYL